MKIQVEFKSQELRKQETKKGNTLFWQKAGYDSGEDWPVVFDVFVPDGQPYPLGKAIVNLALRSDQWGSLGVDPFNTTVERIK